MTKLESECGIVRKYIDVKLNNLSSSAASATYKASIRTFLDDSKNSYFFIVEEFDNGSVVKRAVIEYSDLLEVVSAISKISMEEENDCKSNPDFLQNHFVTLDGVLVGYYVSNKKANWFISDDGYFWVKNYNELLRALNEALEKIELLKQQYGK